MSMRQPSDAAVRVAAIDPSRSFIVQAPAGSGKTELLTDRILALLATVKRPEEIVAITFTRKAASEMHARVLSKLAAAQQPCPEEDYRKRSWMLARQALQRNHEMGWDLLQYPARLSIRTIDAFCSQLVAAMPLLSDSGGLPGIAEKADAHYEAAARATLAMVDDVPAVAQLLEHLDVDTRTGVRMLAHMLSTRDQWLPLLEQGTDLVRLMENLDEAVSVDLARLAEQMPLGWAGELAPCLRQAAQVLAENGNTACQDAFGDWEGKPFGTGPECTHQWQALAGMLLTDKGALRRSVNIRQGFVARSSYKEAFDAWLKAQDPDAPWITALNEARALPAGGYTADQQDIIAVLLQVLMLATGQLQLRFAEMAEVDFIEIALRALQALGQPDAPTDLLLTLDNAIRHILVDEFQDTSQTQIDLLTRLTAGWLPDDGRTLFLVGDPMQSIYRFRKAEVGLFLRVRESGLGTVHPEFLELTNNFRSQGALVDTVNRLCGPMFPKHDQATLGAIRYTPSVAFNPPIDGRGVHLHPLRLPHKASPDETAQAEARADSLIVQLARDALERYPDSPHPVAILVRARSHLNDVVRQLSLAGVPCRAVDLVSLQSRQVISDLVQLARALLHPADRLAWLSVLRSPLCGLTLDTLHALAGHDHERTVPELLQHWLENRNAEPPVEDTVETRRLEYVAQVLMDTGNQAGTLPFAAWLEQCWKRLGGPAIYHTESDHADVESLLQRIEALAPWGNLDPAALEKSLDDLFAAPRSSGRAVEVMTIHKAKGLEFESVILMGLHKRGQHDTAPLIRFEHSDDRLLLGPVKRSEEDQADPVSRYLSEREKKRNAFEVDRLLYVAMTRARSELHLVANISVDEEGAPRAPTGSSLLARLWDHLTLPDSFFEEADQEPSDQQQRPAGQRYLVRPATPVRDLRLRDEPRLASSPMVGQQWVWRTRAQTERVLGTVAHAWLERIGRDGVDAWSDARLNASREAFRRQLGRAGVGPDVLDEAVEILHETLRSTLASERGRWLLGVAKAYREWALLDLSGRVSVIDLAISHDQHWLVVDYKTGVPEAGETVDVFAQRMRQRYQEQLDRYCAHVSALDGRPARAALYFPRADVWIEC